jgi:hypothetical protein
VGRATTPPNKELKLTKPSIMELRSLTPVFGRPGGARGVVRASDSMKSRGPRRLSLVKFAGVSGGAGRLPFKVTRTYLFLGEIAQMPGHCVVVDVDSGRVWSGYHTENFREVPDDEA